MKYLSTLVLILSLAGFGWAQEYRSTISGIVTDPSAAIVAGAHVAAVNTRTGVKTSTVSNRAGQYVLPFLPPGRYRLTVSAPGFQTTVRPALQLNAATHAVIDVRLRIGSASQTVEVRANVPLLNRANGDVGETISAKQVADLPLNGRTPMMLAALATGVVATSNPTLVHPFDNNGAAAWAMGGTPAQTSALLLDGAPDEMWSGSLAYSPPQDAVQEVTVKVFNTDSTYGDTIGGTANQILKSGTNQFHGDLYEFTQPSNLDANGYFADANPKGTPPAVTHFNQYGLSVGGPVLLPKIYNGRNKLFWFFAWQNLDDEQPTADVTTVPTAAERSGDFSSLLNLGSSYQLYNPFSGTLNGKTIERQPFSGNVIPSKLINPVAKAILNMMPLPNTPGSDEGQFNYTDINTSKDTFNNEIGMLDWNMSNRSQVSFNLRHNFRTQSKDDYFGESNPLAGELLTRDNWGTTLDEVYTISPTTLLDVRANWTYLGEVHGSPSAGMDLASLGFPSYMSGSSLYPQLPYFEFQGSCGGQQKSYQCLGDESPSAVPSQSEDLFGEVTKSIGNHTLKFGADVRLDRMDATTYKYSAGEFVFNNSWVTGPTSSSKKQPFGGDLAAFLLGLPSKGAYQQNAYGAFHAYSGGYFFEDDWRATPTLTLNLGLRLDHFGPWAEQQGRAVNGFAFSTASPVEAAAQAAYAQNPITQLPAADFRVPGGLTFASLSDGAVYTNATNDWSPRLGFSWAPAVFHGATVFRGGIGRFVAPVTIADLAGDGKYSSNPLSDQEGFTASTSFVATQNDYLTPSGTLSNPFPNGLVTPTGAAAALATDMGQAISFLDPNMQDPYSIRWNLGVQHSFSANTMLELDYTGNHGVHLPVAAVQVNGIPAKYLNSSSSRDNALITELSGTQVANPFKGLLPGTNLNGSTTTLAQLLAPYPEFPDGTDDPSGGVLMQNATLGSSYFESMDARLVQRLSGGLSLITSYTLSKLIARDTYLNPGSLQPEKRISPFDHSNDLVVATSYQLPLGRGLHWGLSGWANTLLGGWTVNGIYTYETGMPVYWTSDMLYSGAPLDSNPGQATSPAFNVSAFDTNPDDQFGAYHIRTFPSTLSSVREEGINNLDFSVLKNFAISERSYFQFRAESFNLFNRVLFGAPDVDPTAGSAFGMITSQANLPRQIQLGLRFVF